MCRFNCVTISSGHAGRSDHDQPAVQLEARQRFGDGRQIVEAGETLAELSAIRLHLAGTRETFDRGKRADHHLRRSHRRVLHHLRRRAVRHLDHPDAAAFVQEAAGHDARPLVASTA